jgi:hypothetical protein
MRLLYAAALGLALASPSVAQDTSPLDTRMCPDGSATLPNGSPCPPIVTQQGGSSPGDVTGSGGNATRNNNNTGGSTILDGTTAPVDPQSTGSGATQGAQ